jgi:DNA-binding NtrC family response regulator
MEGAMAPARVVILDLDSQVCSEDHSEQLARLLCDVTLAGTVDLQMVTHVPASVSFPPPDLILLRLSPTAEPSILVQDLRHRWSAVPILGLFCTDEEGVAARYQSLLAALDDFLMCPFRRLDVALRLQQVLRDQRDTRAPSPTEETTVRLHRVGIVGDSTSFLQILNQALRVAHVDATVLLCGETGTGKELVAQAIHYCSPRQAQPFVPVNCGALPEHLVENELFGHAKGAYTDAVAPERGLVAEAEGGTLFLDEVDTLSASAQVKLLRFLHDRTYRPVGSAKSITADVRVLAATNAELWQLVQANRFREDLYYRLHVIALRLPPLRERPDDIPRLARHFLQLYNTRYGSGPRHFSAATLHKLLAYSWPGNVRELETVIHRAVLLTSSSVLQADDIALPLPSPSAMPRNDSFCTAKAQVVAQFERTYLVNLLTTHEGNISRAAKHARKERRAFTRLLQKYDLNRQQFQA